MGLVTIDLNELGRQLKAAEQDVIDLAKALDSAETACRQADRAYNAAIEHRRQLRAAAAKAIGLPA
jgi:hypothetical protein